MQNFNLRDLPLDWDAGTQNCRAGALATAAPLWPESLGELLIEIFQTNVKMAAEL